MPQLGRGAQRGAADFGIVEPAGARQRGQLGMIARPAQRIDHRRAAAVRHRIVEQFLQRLGVGRGHRAQDRHVEPGGRAARHAQQIDRRARRRQPAKAGQRKGGVEPHDPVAVLAQHFAQPQQRALAAELLKHADRIDPPRRAPGTRLAQRAAQQSVALGQPDQPVTLRPAQQQQQVADRSQAFGIGGAAGLARLKPANPAQVIARRRGLPGFEDRRAPFGIAAPHHQQRERTGQHDRRPNAEVQQAGCEGHGGPNRYDRLSAACWR